jgi:hypothetical protein
MYVCVDVCVDVHASEMHVPARAFPAAWGRRPSSSAVQAARAKQKQVEGDHLLALGLSEQQVRLP